MVLNKFDSLQKPLDNQEYTPIPIFDNNEDFIIMADSASLQNGLCILTNAIIFVQDSTKYAKIESPLVNYQSDKKQIDSESGRLFIYDKTSKGGKLRTDIFYKKLLLFKVDDAVGLRIILKEIKK